MWDWINGHIDGFERKYIIEPGDEYISSKFEVTLADLGKDIWSWFVDALPDIAGYGVFATGAIVMLSPLISKSGMMKPLAFLTGGLIVTVCILATN